MSKTVAIMSVVFLAVFALACGTGSGPASAGKTIASGPVGNKTVTLASADGVLRRGKQELTVTFAESGGKPVDVGAASLNFFMPAMGSMAAMNNAATLTTTGTPGVYKGSVDIEMAGEWQAQVAFDGPAGRGKGMLPVTAQ